MKIVMLGATQGMGRALARAWAARGEALFLLGRRPEELERSAKDLEVRGAGASSPVGFAVCDLLDPDGFAQALERADAALDGFDTVVVTAGLFATQDELERDPALRRRVLAADFQGTVEFCEEAKARLLRRGGGRLVVFSSVAGDRGRKPVVLYGAAKAGLSRYLEGLDHRHHGDGLRVVTVKPGFVKTAMTAGLDPPPFAGTPEAVAERVVRAVDRGTPVVYAPAVWGHVMRVIRWLPRALMRRIGF